MEPLDLTVRAPRACTLEVGGIAFLGRAIDKTLATLPGGRCGAYFNELGDTVTLSAMFYRAMKIAHMDFESAVIAARDDDDVATWLRARVGAERIAKWNERLVAIRLRHLSAAERAGLTWFYAAAAELPDDMRLVDVIDADDAAMFSGSATKA